MVFPCSSGSQMIFVDEPHLSECWKIRLLLRKRHQWSADGQCNRADYPWSESPNHHTARPRRRRFASITLRSMQNS